MTISTPSDTMSRQITLEHEMRGLGQHAYMQRALKATERGRASTTEGGVSVAKHLLGPFITAVNGWREDEWTAKSGRKAAAARLIALTDTSVACYLTLRAIIDGAARQKPLAAVAVQIGDLIEDDVMIGHAAGEMPQYVTKLIEALDKRTSDYSRKRAVILGLTQKKGVIWSHWTHEEKLHLGSQLVSILSESTGFVAIETFRESRENTVKMVTLTLPAANCSTGATTVAPICHPCFFRPSRRRSRGPPRSVVVIGRT